MLGSSKYVGIVFSSRAFKKLSSVHRTASLKRTVLYLAINSCHCWQPFISRQPWCIKPSFNLWWGLKLSVCKIISQHSTFFFFPQKKCEVYFQGCTFWCKYDFLCIPRPRQGNWNQPRHGPAASMKGSWRRSRQRGSYVQSPLMR